MDRQTYDRDREIRAAVLGNAYVANAGLLRELADTVAGRRRHRGGDQKKLLKNSCRESNTLSNSPLLAARRRKPH